MRTCLTAGLLVLSASAAPADDYKSPYSVKFAHPLKELVGDLDGPRGDWRLQSDIPATAWNSPAVHEKWGSWGPPARQYPVPPLAHGKSADWLRERVLATALRFQGYGYRHHHIPDWNPPAAAGSTTHAGKGVDCSNFTAFAYNLSLGVKPNSGIKEQAAELVFPGLAGKAVRIDKPGSYDAFVKSLKTADLLYVSGKPGGEVTHVVMWVGHVGQGDVPLILDSHGSDVKDSNGVAIPNGIHLRPFHKDSWYFHSASHAHRLIRD